ncbi:MAG: hypothetical protein Q7S82_01655 [bacterium]|nr:hypothetical protein [bacterium]
MKFFNFLSKLIFLLRKPKIIFLIGGNRKLTMEIIFHVLKRYPKIAGKTLISESDLKDVEGPKFFIKNSSLPIFVITDSKNISFDKIKALSKAIPGQGFLISNFDEEQNRELKTETPLGVLCFGFQSGADFQASDVNNNGDTNFKINYKGNIVPVWLRDISGREYIYAVLAVAAVGDILGLNLVEISEALKDYKDSATLKK